MRLFGALGIVPDVVDIVTKGPCTRNKDLDLLLALLKRLDIRIIKKTADRTPEASTKKDQDFILQGLPAREDFEDFVRDFEESRQDRPLPGRQ